MSDEPIVESEPPAQEETVDVNQQTAAENLSEGEEMVECPTCHNSRRAFLIDAEGKCDSCRARDEQAQFPAVSLGWPEVRQRRKLMLDNTDMTQIEDYPSEQKLTIRGLRQQLRDITTQPDPMAAWRELDRIQRDIQLAR